MEQSIFITETEKVVMRLRLLANYSNVARKAGVSPSTLSKLARGITKNPTVEVMARIENALDSEGSSTERSAEEQVA